MKCIAFITNNIQAATSLDIVARLSENHEVDIFEIPQTEYDGGKRENNITHHIYKRSDNHDNRFTELMRDLLAVHPSKCYILDKSEFGIKAYNVCETYGIDAEFL